MNDERSEIYIGDTVRIRSNAQYLIYNQFKFDWINPEMRLSELHLKLLIIFRLINLDFWNKRNITKTTSVLLLLNTNYKIND